MFSHTFFYITPFVVHACYSKADKECNSLLLPFASLKDCLTYHQFLLHLICCLRLKIAIKRIKFLANPLSLMMFHNLLPVNTIKGLIVVKTSAMKF